jgi:hypothetical protein
MMGMVRFFTFVGGVLWGVTGLLWATSKPLAAFLLNWSRGAKVPDSEQTYWQQAAADLSAWATAYYDFMQANGPFVFIVSGAAALVLAIFWKRVAALFIDSYGLKLRAQFENYANLPQYRSEPFIIRRLYYDKNDRKRMITHSDFYIGVLNDTTNETIDNIRVKLIYAGIIGSNFDHNLCTKENKTEITINPKVTEYFKLGIAIDDCREMTGARIEQDTPMFNHLLEESKRYGIQIPVSKRNEKTNAVTVQPLLRNNQEPIILEISGKNVPATFVLLRLDAKGKAEIHFIAQSSSVFSPHKLPRKHFSNRRRPVWRELINDATNLLRRLRVTR